MLPGKQYKYVLYIKKRSQKYSVLPGEQYKYVYNAQAFPVQKKKPENVILAKQTNPWRYRSKTWYAL